MRDTRKKRKRADAGSRARTQIAIRMIPWRDITLAKLASQIASGDSDDKLTCVHRKRAKTDRPPSRRIRNKPQSAMRSINTSVESVATTLNLPLSVSNTAQAPWTWSHEERTCDQIRLGGPDSNNRSESLTSARPSNKPRSYKV